MSKFNVLKSLLTRNAVGHVAYAMDDRSKLVTQVLTSFFNEQKFYGDNSGEMQDVIRRVIQKDPAFVSNLAVFARREFNMRSVAHVLTAFLAHEDKGKPFARRTVNGVSLRGDDLTEIMSSYLSVFGKPVPNSLKKGIADVLVGFDEYTLAKYKGQGKSVKMQDLLCLCHPRPQTPQQEAMWKRCLEGTLATPETWETQLSANGNSAEVWARLIDSGKLGYMACLRNILTAQPSNLNKVLKKIGDPASVHASRQLPFRFLSAYKSVYGIGTSKIFDVLENAMDASIDNLPKLPGTSVIAIDVSGSMSSRVSAKSDICCCEIAVLLGMIANRICDNAIIYTFDTEIRKFAVSHRDGILFSTVHSRMPGGGTNMSLPFTKMMQDHIKCDRVIILSDNMCNHGVTWDTKMPVQSLADEYRRESGKDIWVHAIDLQGYGTQQFCGEKTNIIAGWSEKIFDFILLAEQGTATLEKKIQDYVW